MNKRCCFYWLIVFAIYIALFSACEEKTTPVLRLVQLCDPQFGFGLGGPEVDAENLEKAVTLLNKQNPDIVLVAGDMLDDFSENSLSIFKNILAQIKVPVLLTPGNHDLFWAGTPEILKHYRDCFGKDYLSIDCKGFCIISANSIFWWATGGLQDEITLFEQWLLNSLETAKNKGQPIIILTHIPPFVSHVDEEEDYWNLPKTKRKELLDLFNEYDVSFWLAGHTHTTLQRAHGSIKILNGETTCRNLDDRPLGFRLLTIYSDNSFSWEFTRVK